MKILVLMLTMNVYAVPIEIDTRAELEDIANDLNGDYILTGDIDLENNAWTPIGTVGDKFTGTFDGDLYTISNLKKINPSTASGIGLFGFIANAEIFDVSIDGAQMRGFDNVGSLVGHMVNSTVTNCHVTSLTGSKVEGTNIWAGGLIGHIHPKCTVIDSSADISVIANNKGGGFAGNHHGSLMRNCDADGNVTCSQNYCGALVGYMQVDNINVPSEPTIIRLCKATGNSTATGAYSGGLVGNIEGNSEVDRCRATGNSKATHHAAGAIGAADDCEIKGSHSTGTVETTSLVATNYGGGFIGGVAGTTTIYQSSSSGNVICVGSYCGGFIGFIDDNSTADISECFSTSDVSNTGLNSGGFLGQWSGDGSDDVSISDCYATGDVHTTHTGNPTNTATGCMGGGGIEGYLTNFLAVCDDVTAAGGPVGAFAGIIDDGNSTDCYWDDVVTGCDDACSLTPCDGDFTIIDAGDSLSVYEGFSSLIWEIDSGDDYPTLKWEP